MILSVVILFTDYDYMLLNRAVSSIREHIKFNNYEIIAVDNRDQNKDLISIFNVKIITQNKNLYTFEGRHFGFKQSSGKYIWNFDADDVMIEDLYLEDFPLVDTDFIQINFESADKAKPKLEFGRHPFNYGCSVWSRFYNRNILEKVYSKLEKKIYVPKFEDLLLLDLVWSLKPKYEYINKRLYQYNCLGSNTNKNLKTNIEKLGFDSYYYIYEMVLGKKGYANSLKNRILRILEVEEKKCRNLKKNKNIASQKS